MKTSGPSIHQFTEHAPSMTNASLICEERIIGTRLRADKSPTARLRDGSEITSATGDPSWRALGVSRAGQTTTNAPATLAADTRTADAVGSAGATQLELRA